MRPLKLFAIFTICLLMTLMILYPEVYLPSAYNGLILFAVKVLPALLPFFFFTKLLTSLGAADGLAKAFERPITKAYRCSPMAAFVFAISVLSGYPVGAKMIGDLYNQTALNTAECKKISAFCSTSGFIFIIGTVGSAILCNKVIGYLILSSHIIGALLNGLLYRGKTKSSQNSFLSKKNMTASGDQILYEAVNSAVLSVLIVGCYITVFNLFTDIMINTGVVGGINKLFSPLTSTLNINNQTAGGLFIGLIEITRGVLELQKLALPPIVLTALVTGLISFGGLSVTLQSITFLSSCGIKATYYLKTKLTQAAISFVVALILAAVFL